MSAPAKYQELALEIIEATRVGSQWAAGVKVEWRPVQDKLARALEAVVEGVLKGPYRPDGLTRRRGLEALARDAQSNLKAMMEGRELDAFAVQALIEDLEAELQDPELEVFLPKVRP